MTLENQHAEFTVRVALPVDKDASDDDRLAKLGHYISHYLNQGDSFEFRGFVKPAELTRVETMEEASERHMAEAEIAAEAEMDRRRERYFDERGHF